MYNSNASAPIRSWGRLPGVPEQAFHEDVSSSRGKTAPIHTKVNQQQPFAVATGLDKIINERNSMVHFRTEADFYQSYILPAQALLKRHPTLQQQYVTESLVIDTYTSLKSCFHF